MKTKIQTAFVAILFLFSISCTKENASSSSAQSKQSSVSSSKSSDAEEQSLDDEVDFVVTGNWILYYDWYCSGEHYSTTLNVYPDGTWETGSGYTGHWVKGRRIFMRKYDGLETVYSGIVRSNKKISGIMTTWDGTQGCFYMVPSTDPNFKGEFKKGSRDESGRIR
jgi:hypothetical protein